mmetsp:Transcript_33306/g.105496  ORF Transcript_33306/g.105496 Transcript_33306/m.105496 type:complete len:278 (+) Transcript_33306:58-891(+)
MSGERPRRARARSCGTAGTELGRAPLPEPPKVQAEVSGRAGARQLSRPPRGLGCTGPLAPVPPGLVDLPRGLLGGLLGGIGLRVCGGLRGSRVGRALEVGLQGADLLLDGHARLLQEALRLRRVLRGQVEDRRLHLRPDEVLHVHVVALEALLQQEHLLLLDCPVDVLGLLLLLLLGLLGHSRLLVQPLVRLLILGCIALLARLPASRCLAPSGPGPPLRRPAPGAFRGIRRLLRARPGRVCGMRTSRCLPGAPLLCKPLPRRRQVAQQGAHNVAAP